MVDLALVGVRGDCAALCGLSESDVEIVEAWVALGVRSDRDALVEVDVSLGCAESAAAIAKSDLF